MTAQGIPDFFIRRSAKREGGGEALDELPRYDSFEPAPDDF
jgi:hypothetical protein